MTENIEVLVKPSAKIEKIFFDEENSVYYVHVKEPADKNKANKAVLKIVSKYFKKKARMKMGLTSRKKIIELS